MDQLVSVLQKEIRRGNVDNAVLAAYEMLSTSADVAEHLWRRLKLIAVEDVGMGVPLAPLLLNCLHENFRAAPGGDTMMAVHAVRLLATARKDRTSSEHADLVATKVERGELVVSVPDLPSASTPGQVRRWDADWRSGGETAPWSMTSSRRLITHTETS